VTDVANIAGNDIVCRIERERDNEEEQPSVAHRCRRSVRPTRLSSVLVWRRLSRGDTAKTVTRPFAFFRGARLPPSQTCCTTSASINDHYSAQIISTSRFNNKTSFSLLQSVITRNRACERTPIFRIAKSVFFAWL